MYCKDCEHWKPYSEYFKEVKSFNANKLAGGVCTSKLIDEDYGSEYNYLENSLTYPYEEGGYFWTGAKFGCVNFKEK